MTFESIDNIVCSACDEQLNLNYRMQGICRCDHCGVINALPFDAQNSESIRNLRSANNQLFASEFYNAFNSYRLVTTVDHNNVEAIFSMSLANNKVKYVFDTLTASYQPVPIDPATKEISRDVSAARVLQLAETDEIRAQYQSRMDEIERVKSRFRDFAAQNVRCDVFISSHASPGSAEFSWTQQLCDGLKKSGIAVFDSANGASHDSDLTLYAMKCAKLFVLVCDDQTNLKSSVVQNEYTKFYAIRSGEERAKSPILVASSRIISELPGVISHVRSVDITSDNSTAQVNDFISQIKKVKIKFNSTAPKSVSYSSDSKCMVCGESLGASADGVAQCPTCEYNNVLTKANQKPEVISLINEGDEQLRLANFAEAYTAYSKAALSDPLESRAFFGASLAKNRIRYHFDRDSGIYTEMCYNANGDSVFSNPGVIAAHALASNTTQKEAYTAACDSIDLMGSIHRDFIVDNRIYDVFITVNPSDKAHKQTAEKLHSMLKESDYNPFIAEIDTHSCHKDLRAELTLFALSTAKCMVVICDSAESLAESQAQKDYLTYYSMLSSSQKENHGIILFADDVADRVPGILEAVTCLPRREEKAIDKLHDAVIDQVSTRTERYCENCERRIEPGSKLCPSCFSTKFSSARHSIAKQNNSKKRGFWLNKQRITKWIAQHARPVLIGAFAALMAIIMAIVILGAVNADKAQIVNKDFDITLSAESKVFDNKSELDVTEMDSGTTYQWIKNEISYRTNRSIIDIRVYTIECDAIFDDNMTLRFPLQNSMKRADSDSIFVYSIDGGIIRQESSYASDNYVTANIDDIGTFAVVYLDAYKNESNDNSYGTPSGNTTELYTNLQSAESIDRDKYTPSSLAQMDEAYASAIYVFTNSAATQQQIDEAASALAASIALLTECADVTNLENLIKEAEKLLSDDDRYSDDSIYVLRDDYEYALDIISNKDSTQSDVESAEYRLSHSINNMEKKRSGFATLVVVVISAAVMLFASYIMSEEGVEGKLVVVWIIAVLALLIILSNYPLMPWWKATLIEFVIIVGATIWGIS